jgi:hypothetical protein
MLGLQGSAHVPDAVRGSPAWESTSIAPVRRLAELDFCAFLGEIDFLNGLTLPNFPLKEFGLSSSGTASMDYQ